MNRTISISSWLKTASRVAVAACVVLVGALVVRMTLQGRVGPTGGETPINAPRVHEIVAMDAKPAELNAPRVLEASFGPSPSLARQGFDSYAAGAVVSRPIQIQIAERAPQAGYDGLQMPY
jgi:hypothetical protein